MIRNPFEDEFKKRHNQELWIEGEKEKIVTDLIHTGNLIPGNPYYNKVDLPEEFIREIFILTKALHLVGDKEKTGVRLVSLSADFEKTGGYDLCLDPNTKISSLPFEKVKGSIGKLVNSYKIIAGDISTEIPKDELDLLASMISKGTGPTLKGKKAGVRDPQKWTQTLSEGDTIELVIDQEDQERPLILVKSKTPTSSIELYSYINQKERTDETASFEDFFKGGKLKRLYETHLENSSRNNRRSAWEAQRFLKVKIKGVDDTKAKRDNPYEDAFPKMGVVWTSQQANVLSYHEFFDIKKYTTYLNSVKRNKEVGIFSSLDKAPCVIFHFKTFENKKFKFSDIENEEMGKNWNKWLEMDESGQHVLYRMKRLLESMRVCSFPMVYQPPASSISTKKIEKPAVQEKPQPKFVVKTPKQFEMKKEMLQNKRIESKMTAMEMENTGDLRKIPMFVCNVGKKDEKVSAGWTFEQTNAYKTRICSGIANFSQNKGGIEHILYDSCVKITVV